MLDTHAVLWALDGGRQLSAAARDAVVDADNEILVSAACAIEISIKKGLGRLRAPEDFLGAVVDAGFVPSPLDFRVARRLETLPMRHRDPFDRLLIAHALEEGVPIVTRDPAFEQYRVQVIW